MRHSSDSHAWPVETAVTASIPRPHAPSPGASSRRRAAASMAGAVIDWYDFFLYGIAAATVFGPQYFPSHDQFVGLLASMGSFAVGFVFRPWAAPSSVTSVTASDVDRCYS